MLAHAFARVFDARGQRAWLVKKSEWDVTDYPQVEAMFEDYRPDICINCAAYTKVDLAETESDQADAVNGRAVQTLAEVCRTNDSTLVHFSSDYVFDGTVSRPLLPTDPVGPQSEYGRSKLLGEQLLQQHAPQRWLLIRTSWLYGPNGPNFVQTMLNAARAGKQLTVVDDQIGSPTFTYDLAEVTLDLIDRGATGIYHATNSGQTSWFDFAKAIFEEFNIPNVDLKPISSAKWKEHRPTSAIRPAYSVLDCSATEELIGRKMPHWRDALHRYRLAVE
jgi:dTDP-4-dehydrorhamnose reductase